MMSCKCDSFKVGHWISQLTFDLRVEERKAGAAWINTFYNFIKNNCLSLKHHECLSALASLYTLSTAELCVCAQVSPLFLLLALHFSLFVGRTVKENIQQP